MGSSETVTRTFQRLRQRRARQRAAELIGQVDRTDGTDSRLLSLARAEDEERRS